jgi:hypothetical protein
MNAMMRRTALALSLGLALGLGACSNDSTGVNGSVAGTYTLQTVNNTRPPVNIAGYILTADQYTLNNDGTYTEIENFSNAPTYIEHGSFSVNGGTVTFLADDTTVAAYNGSVSSNQLTINQSGYVSVYTR